MKINRTMTIETNEIQIGDRVQVGHYPQRSVHSYR